MTIEHKDVVPLYHQAYLLMRQRLEEGIYLPNQPLPSEPKLSELLGVSRLTLRRTLERLESEGWIERRRGVGTFPRPRDSGVPVLGKRENITEGSSSSSCHLLEWAWVPAAPYVAAKLELAENKDDVLRIVRLRHKMPHPLCLTTIHVVRDIGEKVDKTVLGDRPLMFYLDQIKIPITNAEQVISAVNADAFSAHHLEVREGAALIALRRVIFLEERPIAVQKTLYNPVHYEYRLSLTGKFVSDALHWQSTRNSK